MRKLAFVIALFGSFAALGIGGFYWLEGQERRAYQNQPDQNEGLPQLSFQEITPINSILACFNADLPQQVLACREGSPPLSSGCTFPTPLSGTASAFTAQLEQYKAMQNEGAEGCEPWLQLAASVGQTLDSVRVKKDEIALKHWRGAGMHLAAELQEFMRLAKNLMDLSQKKDGKSREKFAVKVEKLGAKLEVIEQELLKVPEPEFYQGIGRKSRFFYEIGLVRKGRLLEIQPFSPSEVRMLQNGEGAEVKGSPEAFRDAYNELVQAYNGRNPALALQPGGVFLFFLKEFD